PGTARGGGGGSRSAQATAATTTSATTGAAWQAEPARLRVLRHLREGRRVELHLLGDPVARVGVDRPDPVDEEVGADDLPLEVLVVAARVELVGGAVQQEAPAQVAAVRIEEDDVEFLDPALVLHAPEEPDDI